MIPPAPDAARMFLVYAHGDARHCRQISGIDFQDAALAFAHDWSPPADDEGQVSVIVVDEDTGRQQCLCIDLAEDQARPCKAAATG